MLRDILLGQEVSRDASPECWVLGATRRPRKNVAFPRSSWFWEIHHLAVARSGTDHNQAHPGSNRAPLPWMRLKVWMAHWLSRVEL